MGHHKKRSATTSAATGGASSPAADVADSTMNVAIKVEWEKAMNAFRRGNHSKALRLMKESSRKFESSALFHRLHASVSAKVAGIIDEPSAKQRHLRNALESAKKAMVLSPNYSIEFALLYASLLFDTANDVKDYDEVVAECERALAIRDPMIDPEGEKSPAQVQGELTGLLEKAKIAAISSWMKHSGGPQPEEKEKFRLIQPSKLGDDSLGSSRYFSTTNSSGRRPNNEVKKDAKTPEERRKEIEASVAAARLLQLQEKPEEGQSAEEAERGDSSQSNSLGGSN